MSWSDRECQWLPTQQIIWNNLKFTGGNHMSDQSRVKILHWNLYLTQIYFYQITVGYNFMNIIRDKLFLIWKMYICFK